MVRSRSDSAPRGLPGVGSAPRAGTPWFGDRGCCSSVAGRPGPGRPVAARDYLVATGPTRV